jgi:hypothetical protein
VHAGALLSKRTQLYKRSLKAFIVELVVPFALLTFGFWMSRVNFFAESPERDLSLSYYPSSQKIYVTKQLIHNLW